MTKQKIDRRLDRSKKWRIADRSEFGPGAAFRMGDQAVYAVAMCGAFVRVDKDRRSPKERKRARQAIREAQTT